MKFINPQQPLPWHAVGGDDGPCVTITPKDHLLLNLAQWHAVRKQWPTGMTVGVKVPNDTDIETLAEDLPRIALVALHFPKWIDGRAYSQARLLRARLRYAGEVCAIGEVVADMLPLLVRTGFDVVMLKPGQDRAVAERALGFFPAHYQGDTSERQPLFAREHNT